MKIYSRLDDMITSEAKSIDKIRHECTMNALNLFASTSYYNSSLKEKLITYKYMLALNKAYKIAHKEEDIFETPNAREYLSTENLIGSILSSNIKRAEDKNSRQKILNTMLSECDIIKNKIEAIKSGYYTYETAEELKERLSGYVSEEELYEIINSREKTLVTNEKVNEYRETLYNVLNIDGDSKTIK